MSTAAFVLGAEAPAAAQTTSTASAASDETTTVSIVERAIRLTAEKKLDQAETLYRELSAKTPEEGLPLLARFLHRTGRTTASAELLSSEQVTKLDHLTRARVAVAAGKADQAVSVLSEAPSTAPHLYQRAALLATQLVSLGKKPEAAQALEKTVVSPELSVPDRRDLFLKLSIIGGPDHLRRTLQPLIAELISSSTLSYPDIREVAVQGMMIISGSSTYLDFHRDVEAEKTTKPSQAWLYALSMIRKGAPRDAAAALEHFTTATLTTREKVVLYEELGRLVGEDIERALPLYEELIPIAPDPDRLRLIAGQLHFRQKRYDRAAELLAPVDSSKLEDGERGVFKNTYLASLAAVKPGNELVAAYEKEAAGVTYERARELAEAPFVTLPPGSEKTLQQALEARLKDAAAPSELYILKLSIENRFGTPEGLMTALGEFVDARPEVIQAAEEYADAAGQHAYMLMTAPLPPEQAPNAEQKKEVGDRAARALWRVIGTRPYVPDYYLKLIELYRLYEQPEKAARVPLSLSESTTATAEEVHLAAYISAQADLATQSIPLYERALEMNPGNPRFRLNYAGALTRVGRDKEADAIYRDVIENGVAGKQYHAHEIYANSFRLAIDRGLKEDYLKFIRSLVPRAEIPQHDVFLVEMSKILIGMEHPQEAIPFLNAAMERYPETRYQASDLLVQAYVAGEKFDEAERVLAVQEKESTDTASMVLVRSNYAATKAARGDLKAAVDEWMRLAKTYPQERQATRCLVTAAQRLVKDGRLQAATKLLEQYLALDGGDPDGESSARETLQQIQSKDLPSDVLVKAAMEDSLPPVL